MNILGIMKIRPKLNIMCGPPPMINACDNMLDSLGVEKDMIAYDSFG